MKNIITIEKNSVPEFEKIKNLKNWILGHLILPCNITVNSNGRRIHISKDSISRSLKRVKDNEPKKQVYSQLEKLLENAVCLAERLADARHINIEKQELYYNVFEIDGEICGVEISVDVYKDKNAPNVYAGHKVKKLPSTVTELVSNEIEAPGKDNYNIIITDIPKFFKP